MEEEAARCGAESKMSDWEDEYSEDGVAIQKPATNSAPATWKLPPDNRQRENAFGGVGNGPRFGGSREVRGERSGVGGDFNYPRDGGRQFSRSTGWGGSGRRTFDDERSDYAPPVTITVENASVGRVIGRFKFHLCRPLAFAG